MAKESYSQRRKIGRSLAIESGKALKQDKAVILVPLIAFVVQIAVIVVAALVYLLTLPLWAQGNNSQPVLISMGAIMLIVFAFINVFSQAVVMGMANERFAGNDPKLGDSVANASKHFASLGLYAFLEAAVGLLMRMLHNAGKNTTWLSLFTNLLAFFGGMFWAIATYFTIPGILFGNLSAIDSIKNSIKLIKEKWGPALRVNVVAAAFVFIGYILAFIGLMGAVGLVASVPYGTDPRPNQIAAVSLALLSLLAILLITLIQSTLFSYIKVALYRFATGQPLPNFDTSNLEQAFVVRKKWIDGVLE